MSWADKLACLEIPPVIRDVNVLPSVIATKIDSAPLPWVDWSISSRLPFIFILRGADCNRHD